MKTRLTTLKKPSLDCFDETCTFEVCVCGALGCALISLQHNKHKPNGCGSKNRYQNGTLVSGNMDQNLRNPSCLILSHIQMPTPQLQKGALQTGLGPLQRNRFTTRSDGVSDRFTTRHRLLRVPDNTGSTSLSLDSP